MSLAKLRAMSTLKIGIVIHTSGQAQQRTVGVFAQLWKPDLSAPSSEDEDFLRSLLIKT
jgi:hypothetical protein